MYVYTLFSFFFCVLALQSQTGKACILSPAALPLQIGGEDQNIHVFSRTHKPALPQTAAVRVDLSGSVNIHVVGPDNAVQAQPPLFPTENNKRTSTFLGCKYDFRRRWYGVTHVLPTLRIYYSARRSQQDILQQKKQQPLYMDVSREQSLLPPHQSSSNTFLHIMLWGQQRHLRLQRSDRGLCAATLSVPILRRRVQYECKGVWSSKKGDAPGCFTRRRSQAQQHPNVWWSPDVRINGKGQLEGTNASSLWGDRLRVKASVRRNWLSGDEAATTTVVLRFQYAGERTGLTVSVADFQRVSVRQEFAVRPIVAALSRQQLHTRASAKNEGDE